MIFQPPGPLATSAQCRQWLANVVFGSVAPPVENPGVRAKDVRRPDVYRREKDRIARRLGGYPLTCPYSDVLVRKPSEVDIEHVVSLSDAIRSGGWAWTEDQWKQFQSDPAVLTLALPDVNRDEKRAKDIANWTPPHHQGWFATDYAVVKLAFGLSFTKAQADRIRGLLT